MTKGTTIRGRFIFEISTLASLTSILVVMLALILAPPGSVTTVSLAKSAPQAAPNPGQTPEPIASGLATADPVVSPPSTAAFDPGRTPAAIWSGVVTDPANRGRRLAPITMSDDSPSVRIAIDLDDRRQTWIGVGGALTDSSVDLLASGDDELLATLFASDSRHGARLNLVRLPLSASDFSRRAWTWTPIDTGEFAPSVEASRAARVIRDIVSERADAMVVGTPWTAPRSMLGSDGALSEDRETEYAELLEAQVAWLLGESVPVRAVTLGNEPGNLAEYPSMIMSDDQMIRVGELVKPALERRDVRLWAVDHNWADRARVDTLLESSPGTFDAAAFHCYKGTPSQMAGLDVLSIVTECTGTDDNWTSTFGWGSRVLVAESIRAGSTGLVMWNLVLPPTPEVLPGGCRSCRGLVTVDPATGRSTPNPEFFLLAHLSRAADPGAVVVVTDEVDPLPTVAFVNTDGTVGIFGHNDTPDRQTVEFQFSDRPSVTIAVGPWEMFTLRG